MITPWIAESVQTSSTGSSPAQVGVLANKALVFLQVLGDYGMKCTERV